MATLQAAPTRHHHTQQFIGILTWPLPYKGGRDGKNQSTKWHTNSQAKCIATTLRKELQASNCVFKSQGAPARGIGPHPV